MKKLIWVVLFLLTLVPILNLAHPGLPLTHDGQDHVARIANFYQSILEGNAIPRWAGNLNWGYGHPILMFLYPFPSYVASFFHWIGFSLVDATKLVFGLSFVASVLAMYLWLSCWYGRAPAFVGAALYGFAPYRFVDLSVRGAIGEHVAFVFPPLICWGLHLLARRERPFRSALLVSLGTAGLLLSHNALSVMFLPFVVLYFVYLGFFGAKNRLQFFMLGSWYLVLGFLLAAFFWAPAFFEGKYTLRDIVTKGEYATRFVSWQWFLSSTWNYGGGDEFSKELGLLQWLGVVGSVLVFFKTKEKKFRVAIVSLLTLFFFLLFLMTSYARVIWDSITILQKFQFPWRLLSVSVFLSSILGTIVISKLPKQFALFTCFFVPLTLLVTTNTMWGPKDYLVKPESFYTGVYPGTTDTGESSPIWSVRFMEQEAKAPYEVIEGEAAIAQISRSTTKHVFSVDAKKKSRIVDNTLYFPGWTVLVDGKTLPPLDIWFQDPQYRGLINFWLEKGKHTVTLEFRETKLRRFADSVSVFGLLLLVGTVTIGKPWVWLKSR